LPVVRRDLGFSTSTLTWVVTAYTVVFAGLLVLAARLGDRYGHRRLLEAGLVLFAAGSLLCGLAWGPAVLVGARALQGVGAAAVAPGALALLSRAFTDGVAQRRAMSWWTASAAGGGASGWVLGGVLTQTLGWRSVFLVNLPVAAAATYGARRWLTETAGAARDPLDVRGAVTLTGGLVLLTAGLTLLPEAGLTPPVVALLATGVLALAGFVLVEARAEAPLVPLPALVDGRLAPACGVAVLLTGSTTPAMFLVVLYQQQELAASSLRIGLLTAPFNVAVIAGSAAGPCLVERLGGRGVMAAGLLVVAGGAASLLLTGGTSAYPRTVLPGLLLLGAGLGAASVASTHTGTTSTCAGEPGLASGLLSVAAQVGTVLGVATLVPLAASSTGGGYHVGYLGAALVAAAGAAALLVGALLAAGRRAPTR
jgi:MFS family permease